MKLLLLLPFLFPLTSLPAETSLPPESRQFDFWVGEWNVTTADGATAGTSRVELVSGGCGLLETWIGAKGGSGKSLNAWNATTRRWQQYWVGHTGMVLELTGGLDERQRMVLQGTRKDPKGESIIDRITWTPEADGSVRQQWEVSTDSAQTWKTVFDGRYRRRGQD